MLNDKYAKTHMLWPMCIYYKLFDTFKSIRLLYVAIYRGAHLMRTHTHTSDGDYIIDKLSRYARTRQHIYITPAHITDKLHFQQSYRDKGEDIRPRARTLLVTMTMHT